MLKTREPLKLHTMEISTSGAKQFYERISSNYGQIDSRINGTDLLHMVTQPPEIFFAEGDENYLYNSNINIENKQTQKVEILNNLVNRILLSTKGQFTYQDEVYVTNTLRKLGITNEQQFIRDVYNNINETKNVRQSIENVERISKAVLNNVENVSNVSFNKYERNYIAGQISRLNLNYENQFFTKFNELAETTETTENLVNQAENIVNNINETVAKANIQNIAKDERAYINKQIKQLKKEEKNIFYEEFNRTYDNRLYKDYSEEKIDKLVQKTIKTAALRVDKKTPAEIIKLAQEKNEVVELKPLYQQVLNRLDMPGIYNEISQIQSSNNTNNSFTDKEVNLTSFSRVVNEVNLKNAKDVLIAPAEINLAESNVYEQQSDLTDITEESVNNQLTKAILYSIIDTTFNSTQNRTDVDKNNWYTVSNNLYSSADNTINRFEENLIAPVDRSVYESLSQEAILEELEQVEINNNRRVELYQQAVEAEAKLMQQATPKKGNTKAMAMADSLDALNNPEVFLEKVKKEKEQALIRKAFENQDSMDRLPPEIRERVQLIQAITSTDENGNVSVENQKIISQVKNEIMNTNVENNRVERIHKSVNQAIEAGIITEIEEKAIIQELKEVNKLLKDDRKENPKRKPGEDTPKRAHAIEILNKIEQKLQTNITNATMQEMSNVNLDYRTENVLPPELINIMENVQMAPGQAILGDELVQNMQPEIKKAAMENLKLNAKNVEGEKPDEQKGNIINTYLKNNVTSNVVKKATDEILEMNLVHKSQETVGTEEILEKLEEQKQIIKTEHVVNTTNKNIVTEHVTTESTKKLIKNEIENLELSDQIDKTVQRQLHTFETEMFDKLEDKLDNERRRRGF